MSLIFGLGAALAWACHDLVVRRVSQQAHLLPMLFLVLVFGTIMLSPFAASSNNWSEMTQDALLFSALGGCLFALASLALYAAFEIGPVRLVAPIIGAYPLLSLGLAAVFGAPLTALHWLGAITVVSGVVMVALLAGPTSDQRSSRRAIVMSLLAAGAFAFSFATTQAATRAGAEIPVMFLTRLAAVLCIGTILMAKTRISFPPRRDWALLILLGLLDTSAIGLIILAGALPHPEFAAVTSSLFGMFTVVLARFILGETMTFRQWIAVGIVFSGIACLGL